MTKLRAAFACAVLAVVAQAASPKRPATVKLKKLPKNRTSSGPTAANATTGALALSSSTKRASALLALFHACIFMPQACSRVLNAVLGGRGAGVARLFDGAARAGDEENSFIDYRAPGAEGGVGWDDVVGAESAVRELRRLITSSVPRGRSAAVRSGAATTARRSSSSSRRRTATSLDAALLRKGRFDKIVELRAPDLEGRRKLFDHYVDKQLKAAAARELSVDAGGATALVRVVEAANGTLACKAVAPKCAAGHRFRRRFITTRWRRPRRPRRSAAAAPLRDGADAKRLAFTVAHAGAAPEAATPRSQRTSRACRRVWSARTHAVVNEAALGAMADGRYVATRADYLRAVEDVLLGKPLEGDLGARRPTGASPLRDRLVLLLAGRAAESHVFRGDVSSGPSDDLMKTAELAKAIVVNFGMSDLGAAAAVGDADDAVARAQARGGRRGTWSATTTARCGVAGPREAGDLDGAALGALRRGRRAAPDRVASARQ
ncbi:ATP-dependent peptidase [Aureococcus anophagefferens]|nr:ATP-dependent peptidase [Aureococcus anophagefferens]